MSWFDQEPERSELGANGAMLNQRFAECLPFAGIIVGVSGTDASKAKRGCCYPKSLRVEIRHDQGKSLVLLADEIVERHVNVVK